MISIERYTAHIYAEIVDDALERFGFNRKPCQCAEIPHPDKDDRGYFMCNVCYDNADAAYWLINYAHTGTKE